MSSFIDEMMRIINGPPAPKETASKPPRAPYQHDMPYYYIATFKDGKTEVIEHLPTWCKRWDVNISSVSRVCQGYRRFTKGIHFTKVMRS